MKRNIMNEMHLVMAGEKRFVNEIKVQFVVITMCHQHHVQHEEEFFSQRWKKLRLVQHGKQLRIHDSGLVAAFFCSLIATLKNIFSMIFRNCKMLLDSKFIQRSRRHKFLQHR